MERKSDSDKEKTTFSVVDLVKGILLLTLAIMGSYLAQMLGCNVQHLLTTDGIAKNIVLVGDPAYVWKPRGRSRDEFPNIGVPLCR